MEFMAEKVTYLTSLTILFPLFSSLFIYLFIYFISLYFWCVMIIITMNSAILQRVMWFQNNKHYAKRR